MWFYFIFFRQPQYFSIGSVRVRFGPISAKNNDVAVAPSNSELKHDAAAVAALDAKESSCCCGVTSSRIPLPTNGSNNRHATGGGSGGGGATCLPRMQAPVYRSSLNWSDRRVQKPSSGCFGKLTTATDRVPLVAAKICETPKNDSPPPSPQSPPPERRETITLDRFQRFRFGSRNGRAAGTAGGGQSSKKSKQNAAPRTTDKSDRLRKLTDKLKQPSVGESQQQLSPGPPPEDDGGGGGGGGGGGEDDEPPHDLMGSKATSTANLSGEESSDKFEDGDCGVGGGGASGIRKPESRTIVGSYYQRSIPFRSASFSQVYYSPSDGKYVRSDGRKRSTPNPVSQLARKAHSSEPVRAYSEDHDGDGGIEVPTPPRRKNKSVVKPDLQSDVAIIEESLEVSVQEESSATGGETPTFLSEWKSDETDSGGGNVTTAKVVSSTTTTPVESPCKEEPQSPPVFPALMPQWSSLTELPLLRPKLSAQSSEEKDEEKPLVATATPKANNNNYRQYLLSKGDSFSEGDSDQGPNHSSQTLSSPNRECTSSPCNDCSDSERNNSSSGGPPVPYSKRPLRGPYLEMIVNEKKKPEMNGKPKQDDLKFLDEYYPKQQILRSADDCVLKRSYTSPDQPSSDRLRLRTSPKRKTSANLPLSSVTAGKKNEGGAADTAVVVHHQRTTSSPSQLEGCARAKKAPEPSPQLLAQLLKGSSEQVYSGGPLTNPLKVNQILIKIIT